MKYEDVVEGLGEEERVVRLRPQVHLVHNVTREDWSAYMAEPLRALWRMITFEKDSWLLQQATYGDWEEFVWQFTKPAPQSHYSERLQSLDDM